MIKIKYIALIFVIAATSAWAGTITVTSPRAGDVLCRGRAYQIRWTSSGVGDQVMVQIIRSSGVATYLTRDTKNNGLLDYTVPATISEGNYTVAVMSLNGKMRGESGTFRIDPCLATPAPPPPMEIAPAIIVGYMNERNVYRVGEYSSIAWTTRGRMPERITISLHPPGCTGVGTYLSTARTSDGHQWVRFPNTLTDGYYSVRVGQFSSSLYGCGGRIHLTRPLVVTQPTAGTVWHPGESVVVRWRYERPDIIGPRLSIFILADIIGAVAYGPLAANVAETAEQARITIPSDLSTGRYAILLTCGAPATYVGQRGSGVESDAFQIVAR